MPEPIRCFKSYDVRGRIPDELNDDIANRIGQGMPRLFSPALS